MRIKSWLWIAAFAVFISSVAVFAQDRGRDRDDRSRGSREASGNAGRSYPDDSRGWENNEREREWREYLKEQKRAYKEWAKANREEQRDFEKYLRERRKDVREDVRERARDRRETDSEYRDRDRENARDRWGDQRERDKAWREYLKERKRAYKDYSGAIRWELDDFHDYIRGRGYRYGDQNGWNRYNEPRNGACFYTDSKYGGERFCLDRNENINFVGDHYNDRISSIQIFGRASVTIFKHKNYGGSRRTYSDDAPHLGDFNDEISAIEVR